MEAVPTDSCTGPVLRHRVATSGLGQCRVEGGVKRCDLRQVGKELASRSDGRQSKWVVKWSQVGERLDPHDRLVVQPRWAGEPPAAMDDPVPDGIDGRARGLPGLPDDGGWAVRTGGARV